MKELLTSIVAIVNVDVWGVALGLISVLVSVTQLVFVALQRKRDKEILDSVFSEIEERRIASLSLTEDKRNKVAAA
jgi:hypothetical protein